MQRVRGSSTMLHRAPRPPAAGSARPFALALLAVVVAALLRAALLPDPGASAAPVVDEAPVVDDVARLVPAPQRVTRPATPPWNGAIEARIARWKDEARRISAAVDSVDQITVGVCVDDLASGEELCAIGADTPLRPASNMKLVTTAAALVLLGPQFEFVTRFEAGGAVERGVLAGDLIVRAGGDPLVRRGPAEPIEGPLDAVARRLVADGLRRVRGDLVLDEGAFADPSPAPGWPDEKQRWAAYCALSGGFTVNGGVLEASVDPGAAGAKASVQVSPAAHGLKRRYDVDTVTKGPLEVLVGATRTTVTVRGRLPRDVGRYEAEFSFPDPVELFGSVLRSELERAGIQIDGSVLRRRHVPAGTPLATLHSPLVGVLEPINARSRNGVADQVLLTLGQAVTGEGTRSGGERAARGALRRLGVDAGGLVQVDGSGLSRENRASPRQIVSLLEAVLRGEDDTARLYRRSLAVAGERGTLADRMRDTPARGRVSAKTGWITGTSALSGVLETVGGRSLAFSILVSYPRQAGGLNTRCFKPMQDEIVTALVEGSP